MTNKEKFVEVFGTNLKRQYATKSWWDQEFISPNMVEEKSCSNCKFWCLDKNDENRRCKYCYNQDEWQAEISDKEKKKQNYKREKLIEELSKMPPMVIATAYLHAINYTLYGEDVTEKWLTAIQNARALEKAYRKGYYEALQKMLEESEDK